MVWSAVDEKGIKMKAASNARLSAHEEPLNRRKAVVVVRVVRVVVRVVGLFINEHIEMQRGGQLDRPRGQVTNGLYASS